MIGNGCIEQYPHCEYAISGTELLGPEQWWWWFPEIHGLDRTLCWHRSPCDKCYIAYNTKDGAIGPHYPVGEPFHNQPLGGKGEHGGTKWKWGMQQSSTSVATNNLVNGNCQGLGAQGPRISAELCTDNRAGMGRISGTSAAPGLALGAYFSDINSTVLFNNNDFITYANTVLELGCGTVGGCTGGASYNFNNNIWLGYTVPTGYIPGGNGQMPGVFFFDTPVTMNCANNIGFAVQDLSPCTTTTIANVDPKFVSEPAQGSVPPESALYGSQLPHYSSSSPAISAG